MSGADASEWVSTVDAFRHACEHAAGLICSEAVAVRWAEPSALPGFTVGGIAGHLLGVLRAFDRRVDLVVTDDVEMVVHADDIASSAGVESDQSPSDAAEITIEFLIAAVRCRMGDVAMLRALAGRSAVDDLRAL